MERYARITGYAVAMALLAGLLTLVGMLRKDLLFPHNRVRVAFPAIGTLMEDDPVKLHGVQIGRVADIEAGREGSIATLELFHRTPLPRSARFVNYNYSLFGARMIIVVPGDSREPMDQSVVQPGVFSSGVAETIHRVEDLLRTVVEYRNLTARLEKGGEGEPSLQELLENRVYPALEEFSAMTRDLELLQEAAVSQLDGLSDAAAKVDRFGGNIAARSDTLMERANRTLLQLAGLTAQATVVLRGLEQIMVAGQDTSRGPGALLLRREMYDKALSLTHALQDLLKTWKQEGLKDIIHFWRNVHLRKRRKAD